MRAPGPVVEDGNPTLNSTRHACSRVRLIWEPHDRHDGNLLPSHSCQLHMTSVTSKLLSAAGQRRMPSCLMVLLTWLAPDNHKSGAMYTSSSQLAQREHQILYTHLKQGAASFGPVVITCSSRWPMGEQPLEGEQPAVNSLHTHERQKLGHLARPCATPVACRL